jgi:GAF domain
MAASEQLRVVETDPMGPQGSEPDLDSNRTLKEIARSAQYVTGASGAALVLSDGKVMSCRACSGELAPPVGTRLNTETGFTATCVQTAEIIRCDDTGTDPRVDGSSCIELGIRSILAVPVFEVQRVVGVLEVLSDEPQRFTERHAAALKLLARLLETLMSSASSNDSSLGILPLDPKSKSDDSGRPLATETKKTCLTCGHPNPQGSQFCNRCGVILLISPEQLDTTLDLALPQGVESSNEQDLKEIYKLVSGSSGLATWDEIYAKLITNLRSVPGRDNPQTAEGKTGKSEDTVLRPREPEGTPEIKSRSGGTIRRSLWL